MRRSSATRPNVSTRGPSAGGGEVGGRKREATRASYRFAPSSLRPTLRPALWPVLRQGRPERLQGDGDGVRSAGPGRDVPAHGRAEEEGRERGDLALDPMGDVTRHPEEPVRLLPGEGLLVERRRELVDP